MKVEPGYLHQEQQQKETFRQGCDSREWKKQLNLNLFLSLYICVAASEVDVLQQGRKHPLQSWAWINVGDSTEINCSLRLTTDV